jgi:predicted alpha/beta-fold hydrolase
MQLARPPLSCRPPLWAQGGYLQSVLGNYLPLPPPPTPATRSEVLLPDGDRLAVRIFAPTSAAPARSVPTVICAFHGLGGHGDRPYMQRVAAVGTARGCEVWTVDHRGCGGGRGLARGIYHSGIASDLSSVFAEVRRRHGEARVIGVGFSLSANALLLCLGDGHGGPHQHPDAAIAVNPPIDLARCADLICAPQHRVFNLYFVQACLRYARGRAADGITPGATGPLHLRMSLKEFDDVFTAPLGGFQDRHDYYRKASALPHLARISRPTVILHAEDDPFIDPADFRRAALGPGVHLHLEKHGGHLGYVSRALPHYRWLDYALGHYLDQLLRDP